MEERNPIKRSKELVSLSSEHHDGLMFCWKVKTGIMNGTGIDRIAQYLFHFYEIDLKPHFEKEEQYLFPLLPESNTLRKNAQQQHNDLVAMVGNLRNGGNDMLAGIAEFNKLLEEHIRFEERQLFPLIEQAADPAAFAKASKEINARKNKGQAVWDDTFWVKAN